MYLMAYTQTQQGLSEKTMYITVHKNKYEIITESFFANKNFIYRGELPGLNRLNCSNMSHSSTWQVTKLCPSWLGSKCKHDPAQRIWSILAPKLNSSAPVFVGQHVYASLLQSRRYDVYLSRNRKRLDAQRTEIIPQDVTPNRKKNAIHICDQLA